MTWNIRWILVLVSIVAGILLVGYIYSVGYRDSQSKVKEENVDAVGKAGEASMSLADCRKFHPNGVYHFDTGKCEWTTSSDGK